MRPPLVHAGKPHYRLHCRPDPDMPDVLRWWVDGYVGSWILPRVAVLQCTYWASVRGIAALHLLRLK